MELDAESKQLLTKLFDSVDLSPFQVQNLEHPHLLVALSPDKALTFGGEAKELLRDLSKRLAGTAISGEGLSVSGAEHILIGACEQFLDGGSAAARSWLKAQFRQPSEEWIVVEPARVDFRGEQLELGRCRF